MARRSIRSISVPITLAAVAITLSAFLLVGWTVVIAQNLALTREVTQNVWLMALGIVSFIVIMSVLVMFSVFLAREILEVRRQNSFIDSVTHELKSPLASIKLCLQTLARDLSDPGQREDLRRMMLDDVDRLTSFVDDVLQASRVTHSRIGIALSEVAVGELLERTVESARQRYRLESDAIRLDVPSGLSLRTDAGALAIVAKNLIDNAVKYSDAPVCVEVRAHEDDRGGVLIEVKDHGIGICGKDLRRVFHRFYRVAEESVRKRRGTGLGLFVVSALVRDLGGRVRALSDGPGHGTTMRVNLPSSSGATSAGA